MSNWKENPRYNIVSCRITDKDYAKLLQVSKTTGRNKGDVLKAAIVVELDKYNIEVK